MMKSQSDKTYRMMENNERKYHPAQEAHKNTSKKQK